MFKTVGWVCLTLLSRDKYDVFWSEELGVGVYLIHEDLSTSIRNNVEFAYNGNPILWKRVKVKSIRPPFQMGKLYNQMISNANHRIWFEEKKQKVHCNKKMDFMFWKILLAVLHYWIMSVRWACHLFNFISRIKQPEFMSTISIHLNFQYIFWQCVWVMILFFPYFDRLYAIKWGWNQIKLQIWTKSTMHHT